MLNKPVDEIVMEGGHVIGVKSEGEVQQGNLTMPFSLFTQIYSPGGDKKVKSFETLLRCLIPAAGGSL